MSNILFCRLKNEERKQKAKDKSISVIKAEKNIPSNKISTRKGDITNDKPNK